MRRKRILTLILFVAVFAGCTGNLPGEGLISNDIMLSNLYLGMTMTLPQGWWLYDLNKYAFNKNATADPKTWNYTESDFSEDYYVDLLYIGSEKDSTSLTHSSFMIFAEYFPYIETLEDFANLTKAFYASTDEGYTAVSTGMEAITHNGTSYYKVSFTSTHEEHDYTLENYYYVCYVNGLFITIYMDFWEGNDESREKLMGIFDTLMFVEE